MRWIGCAFVLALFGFSSSAKNVLIIDSVDSPSHQVWMHRLTKAVAERGYNVTTLTCTPMKSVPENVHMFELERFFASEEEEAVDLLDMPSMSSWDVFFFFQTFLKDVENRAIASKALREVLNYPTDFTFDLIIYDYLGPVSMFALIDRFPAARLIGASAYPAIEYTDRVTKGPHFPSFSPILFMSEVEDTFCSRLQSFVMYWLNDLLADYKSLPETEKMVREQFKLKKSLAEIYASTTILLANHNPVMDVVVPILPNVIPVGGLQIADAQPLPMELEQIYSAAKKGVILFSLGSNVKSELLGEKRLEAIAAALAEFPEYNVIWKIDVSKLSLKLPKNVFIQKWLPQNDILADNRTKIFISHAGGLSTQEATWHGKPMILLPCFVDQILNAQKAVKSGMGVQLDIRNITKEALQNAITEILGNDEYNRAAKLRSRNFQDQKEKPIERALWWIDYIARNPDVSFLRNQNLDRMNYLAKHSIDVVAFLTVVVLGILLVFARVVCWCLKRQRSVKSKVKVN